MDQGQVRTGRVLLDAGGRVLHVNEAAAAFLGRGTGDLAGEPLAGALFDAAGGSAFLDVLSVVRDGASWTGELTVKPYHRVPHRAVFSVRPVRDSGAVVGALVQVSGPASGDAAQAQL